MNNPLLGKLANRTSKLQASEIREILKLIENTEVISFSGGVPDPQLIPVAELQDGFRQALGDKPSAQSALQYSMTEGYQPLRERIAARMNAKGANLTGDNILITNGSQQALDLIAKLFLNVGDPVAVTRPSYLGAFQVYNTYEADYIEMGVDADGPLVDQVEEALNQNAKLIYLNPDFQNPTGNTVSAERRRAIIELAKQAGVPIVEDAAYQELHFAGNPQPPMAAVDAQILSDQGQSIDDNGTVLFCGTFSKTVAPALRVGWIAAPAELTRRLTLIKQASDLHTSTINQIVLAKFLEEHFDQHVQELRVAYSERRDAMLDALSQSVDASQVKWTEPNGGLFVWLEFLADVNTKELLTKAVEKARVSFVPVHAFYAKDRPLNALRLSYSLVGEKEIRDGIQRLGESIRLM